MNTLRRTVNMLKRIFLLHSYIMVYSRECIFQLNSNAHSPQTLITHSTHTHTCRLISFWLLRFISILVVCCFLFVSTDGITVFFSRFIFSPLVSALAVSYCQSPYFACTSRYSLRLHLHSITDRCQLIEIVKCKCLVLFHFTVK